MLDKQVRELIISLQKLGETQRKYDKAYADYLYIRYDLHEELERDMVRFAKSLDHLVNDRINKSLAKMGLTCEESVKGEK